MLPDRVSNPGPLTYESGALPIALCGPATAKAAATEPVHVLDRSSDNALPITYNTLTHSSRETRRGVISKQ